MEAKNHENQIRDINKIQYLKLSAFHLGVNPLRMVGFIAEASTRDVNLIEREMLLHYSKLGAVLFVHNIILDGVEQDCSSSCVLAMELLQSCTEP